jgi:hypothetical protein
MKTGWDTQNSSVGSGFGSDNNLFWIFGLFRHAQRRVEPPSLPKKWPGAWSNKNRILNVDLDVGVASY